MALLDTYPLHQFAKLAKFNDFILLQLIFSQKTFQFCNRSLGNSTTSIATGDGQCDDNLNIKNCNYDGGDCCLSDDKMDASFCIKCFCHITESNFHQFLGFGLNSFWSYPWGSGSSDQFDFVITGNFLTLRIFVHIYYSSAGVLIP